MAVAHNADPTVGKVQQWRPLELMQDPNITKSDFSDFIGVWENFVPAPFCDQCIGWFENLLTSVVHLLDQKILSNILKSNNILMIIL